MRALIILWGILSANLLLAQTGPGGVGNSSTTSLWLKPDVGTSTTSNLSPVSQWNDMSGNNNNATQATANQRPLYTTGLINGMPALFFDNVSGPNNDMMVVADNDNLDNTDGLTILTVTRPISIDNSAARAIISKRIDVSSQQAYTVFYYTNNRINVDIEGNNNRFQTPSAFQAGRDYVVNVLYDGTLASGSRAKVYINENLDVTATESATILSNSASPVTIATMNTTDGRPYGGYIAEVVIYRKALNTAERLIASNYLFAKYGMSSASVPAAINDIYNGDDPANGNYDFEVAGLGQTATGSNLSVAASASGGISVAAVSGYDDNDYLLFGHAAGDVSTQITDVGGMTGTNNGRWNRVWYFDVTNSSTNQTVDISFDMSDAGQAGLTPVTASNYVLLARAGQFGNWTEVATASSITGDQLNFPGISVTSDGYYTLGSKNYLVSPLPITLVDFSGESTEKGVVLTWTTATEHNSDHFVIERSFDGFDFKPIARIDAAGNSTRKITYTALDANPFDERTYYRLVQSDFNGTSSRLKTIAVTGFERSRTIEVIPNPSNGSFWFELPAGEVNSSLKIMNSAGAIMPLTYSQTATQIRVDAQGLPKGLYFLMLVNDRGMHTAKIVIE